MLPLCSLVCACESKGMHALKQSPVSLHDRMGREKQCGFRPRLGV